MLQSYRLEVETQRLWQLRKTHIRQLAVAGTGIVTVLGIVKAALEIIKLMHKK
jgi:hypothetical protein